MAENSTDKYPSGKDKNAPGSNKKAVPRALRWFAGLRPLHKWALLSVLGGYLVFVSAGFVWLRFVKGFQQVSIVDVAFVRMASIRKSMGAQHFARARRELTARNYQAALLAYNAGLRNDPRNTEGRLEAATFLIAAGASGQGVNLLEEGLLRDREDTAYVLRAVEILSDLGRDTRVLELLRGPLVSQANGREAPAFHTVELKAILTTQGSAAALAFLARYPSVRSAQHGPPVVARVLWEGGDKAGAVTTLRAYLGSKDAGYIHFAQAADYLESLQRMPEARDVAREACARMPGDQACRLLLLGTLSPLAGGSSLVWEEEVRRFIKDFGDRPEALGQLAEMAGKKGWAPLARALLELGLERWPDVTLLSLYYSDALMRTGKIAEAKALLAQVDLQVPENDALSVQVKARSVVVAAALGRREEVRDNARSMAAALAKSPERFAAIKTQFEKMGIKEAADEFSGARRTPAAKPTAAIKK